MTLEEYNILIKQKEKELKELKRQREPLIKYKGYPLKELRREFIDKQSENYLKLDMEKQIYICEKYAHLSREYFPYGENYFARNVWYVFRLKALNKIGSKTKGIISCTEEELKEVIKIIKELEKQMEKDMGL